MKQEQQLSGKRAPVKGLRDFCVEAMLKCGISEIQQPHSSRCPGDNRLKREPDIDGNRVTVQIKVEGAGDYLPKYSGNLDIMTSAAVAAGEEFARELLRKG